MSGGILDEGIVAAKEGVELLFTKGERPRLIDSSGSACGSSFIESDGVWFWRLRLLIG
jgi:hypothetical protein